jgi:hypothetical protein
MVNPFAMHEPVAPRRQLPRWLLPAATVALAATIFILEYLFVPGLNALDGIIEQRF